MFLSSLQKYGTSLTLNLHTLFWTIAQCLPCAHLADLNLLFGRSTKKFEDEDLPEILRPVQKLSSNDSQLRDNENAVATVDQSISG